MKNIKFQRQTSIETEVTLVFYSYATSMLYTQPVF